MSYLRVKMGGMIYGYARVSTDDQNPALQQGILGRDVGKASEALRMPKGGARIGQAGNDGRRPEREGEASRP